MSNFSWLAKLVRNSHQNKMEEVVAEWLRGQTWNLEVAVQVLLWPLTWSRFSLDPSSTPWPCLLNTNQLVCHAMFICIIGFINCFLWPWMPLWGSGPLRYMYNSCTCMYGGQLFHQAAGRKGYTLTLFVVIILQQTLDHGVLDLSMALQGQASGQSANNQRCGHFFMSKQWKHEKRRDTCKHVLGHFPVAWCLCFKTSLSAKPYEKDTLICMKMKLHAELIFIWMVSHLDSLWNRGTGELRNGLLHRLEEKGCFEYESVHIWVI